MLLVKVTTRNINDPDEVTRRTIDFHNKENHQWLRKHNHWAMNTGFSVTIAHVDIPESLD